MFQTKLARRSALEELGRCWLDGGWVLGVADLVL
jgi:hypothetical protein